MKSGHGSLRQTDADEVVADERRHLRCDEAGDASGRERMERDERAPPITGRERPFERVDGRDGVDGDGCVYCHAGPPPTDDISDVISGKGYDRRVADNVRTFAQRTGVGNAHIRWSHALDSHDRPRRRDRPPRRGVRMAVVEARPAHRVHPDRQPRPRSRQRPPRALQGVRRCAVSADGATEAAHRVPHVDLERDAALRVALARRSSTRSS